MKQNCPHLSPSPPQAFLDGRLKWRPGQALTVLELRAYRLARPLVVRPHPRHFGCFSWLRLIEEDVVGGGPASLPMLLEGAAACISDGEWERRQEALRAELRGLDVAELSGT